ncbi:MAG: ADP-ribosylglycohydrolase family protein, partial [Bacillota bacterium]
MADAWERESKDQEQRQEQEQGYIHPIDRMLGGLWGAIVGDALGVPVEFSWRKDLKRDPVTDMRGYGTYNLPPGSWSDDSSMLLCTVEALCEPGYDAQRLAELYLEWYQDARWTPHGVVFDIGSTTRRAMQRVLEGVEPEKAGDAGAWDNGN